MKKILCIDGGGIKGLFSAKILEEIENRMGNPIYTYFDMISGTSTGAIIAAGLSLDIPASEICELYIKNASVIFPQTNKAFHWIKRLFFPKYNNEALIVQLQKVFQDMTIGHCKTRLLIPSYNLSTGSTQVFKTSHSKDLEYDYKRKIVDVLLATTAAPTYLPPHRTLTGTYVDGGIGANNPSLLALVEAISYRCQWAQDEIYLLSLGCLESISFSTTGREKMAINDIQKLISIFMNAESQYSHNITQILLPTGHYLRINPIDRANLTGLDKSTPEALGYLQAMAAQAVQEHFDELKNIFFSSFAEPFHPYHSS